MREIAYYVDELVMLCEEYKAVARKNAAVERLDGLRDAILSIIEKLQPGYTSAVNADSAFFAGELDSNMGEKQVQYPTDDVIRYMERRKKRRADAEEEAEQRPSGGRHGNTKIPFGLCQREGIKVNPKWSPRDAWDALAKKGYDVGSVYRELKETGKVSSKKPAASTPSPYKRTEAQAKTLSGIIRKTANLKKEQYRIVDGDGNVVVEEKGDRHEVKSTVGQKREHLPGNVSIHNHPDGGTFSADDLSDFGYGAREIVVASPEGEYSLVNAKYDTKERYEGWHAMREAYEKACPNDVSGFEILQKARKNLENCEERQRMNAISHEFVQRKDRGESLDSLRDWLATTDYDALEALYKEKLKKEQRRIEVEPHDRFMKENAEKYGFTYTFTPARRRQSKGRSDSADSAAEDQAAAIEAYRRRRQSRLDAKAQQEEGRWVTTENDHKVHLNEEGVPDKGNPHVLATMRGEGKNPKTPEEVLHSRVSRKSKEIRDAAKRCDDLGEAHEKAVDEKMEADKALSKQRRGFRRSESSKRFIENLGYGEGDKDKMLRESDDLQIKMDKLKNNRPITALSEEEKAKFTELEARKNQVDYAAAVHDDCYGPNAFTEEKVKAAQKRVDDADKAMRKAEQDYQRSKKDLRKMASNGDIDKVKIFSQEERSNIEKEVLSRSGWGDMNEEQRQKAMDVIRNASDAEISLLRKTFGGANIVDSHGQLTPNGSRSWYTPGTGCMTLHSEDMDDPRVLWHEYGHYLDDAEKSGCSSGNTRILGNVYKDSLSHAIVSDKTMHSESAAADLQNLIDAEYPGKFRLESVDGSMIRVWDESRGEYVDGSTDMSISYYMGKAVSKRFFEFRYRDKEYEDFMKSIDCPLESERPKWDDYFEYYITPKRKLERTREKFKGAEEEYHRKNQEFFDRRDKAMETHREEYERETEAYYKRVAERDSVVGTVSDILCGMMRGEGAWIEGFHTRDYYAAMDAPAKEAVAHYHQLRVMRSTYGLELLKSMVPSVAKGLEEAYNEWLWRNVEV